MNRFLLTLPLCFLLLIASCKKEANKDEEPKPVSNEVVYNAATSYDLQNISYASDPQQKMDIYLPVNRNVSQTKVFVLIHGGGWSAGDKADYTYFLNSLKSIYPDHAVINLNYRLATSSSPAYPKQINDIQAAMDHIQLAKYNLSKQYCLVGSSAGGHLSLLYGYAFDNNHYVKIICNTVGPADLTDSAYTQNPIYAGALSSLVGNVSYAQNPTLYEEVSPAKRVTPSSPKTISFYGDSDPLIPSSQMPRLHNALNAKNIYNEATMYPGGGHGGWTDAQNQDAVLKMMNFINTYF
jgi:acetyl esterase/lipase